MSTTLTDNRAMQALNWLSSTFLLGDIQLLPLAGDASFRRYFRVRGLDQSYVLMDAPPENEPCAPFVAIAHAFRNLGLYTPEIFAADVKNGFLLLSDFGDQLYLTMLNAHSAPHLYQKAFDALFAIQRCKGVQNYTLPQFTQSLYLREMELFRHWYLQQIQLTLTAQEHAALDRIFALLIQDALAQPQVVVHRDFHSRNLMVLESGNVGILDFQDAVWGPVTYDLLSLLRDCYIDWPIEQVEAWVLQFHAQAQAKGFLHCDARQFLRWFDWIGLQRNLKCIGIFSRLKIRDNKHAYLQDIPRVLNYAYTVCERYEEFVDLKKILNKCMA